MSAVSVSGAATVSEGAVVSERSAVSSVYSAGAVMAGLVSVSGLRVPTKCNARALSGAGGVDRCAYRVGQRVEVADAGGLPGASYKPFTG